MTMEIRTIIRNLTHKIQNTLCRKQAIPTSGSTAAAELGQPPSPGRQQTKDLTPEQLIGALNDAVQCEQAHAEIKRRIDLNVATRLAVRFLLPSSSKSEREDAFDGLVGLCLKARGNLAIYPTYSEIRQGMTWEDLTREFAENFVLNFFNHFKDQGETAILGAALKNEFRYIGRRFWSRLRDRIRMRSAQIHLEPQQEPLDEHRLDLLPTPDSSSTLSSAVEARFTNSSTPLEFVRARKPTLSDALGERNYQALEALTEAFPEAYEDTDQAAKSALTRAIERKRGISPPAARQSKRDLCDSVSAKVRSGNRDLNDLYQLIAHGEDENTLRLEFPSRDGRRKQIVRYHIEFLHR
jgi:hypothetical protein